LGQTKDLKNTALATWDSVFPALYPAFNG